MILVYGSCSYYWRGRIGSDLWRRFRRARVPLGAQAVIPSEVEGSLESFSSGFSLRVPLMDTTIYLDYLANRFVSAGGSISAKVQFEKLEDVDRKFDLVINCAGIG